MKKDRVFSDYSLLCLDLKHQIQFIDDPFIFDFTIFEETIAKLKNIQKKLQIT